MVYLDDVLELGDRVTIGLAVENRLPTDLRESFIASRSDPNRRI